MKIYEEVVARRIEHANHASDLYIPVNEETRALVAQYDYKMNVTTFVSQIDMKLWYDVPFAFLPYWESKVQS